MAPEEPPYRSLPKALASAVQRKTDFRQGQIRRLGDQIPKPIVVRLDHMAASIAPHLLRLDTPRLSPQDMDVADRTRSDTEARADSADRATGLPRLDDALAEIIR